MTGRGAFRWFGRAAERLTGNWLFDFVTGNWFDRSVDTYLDRSNTKKRPSHRRYLDADGVENAQPPSVPSDVHGRPGR